MSPVRAVLFDRDGTLVHDVPYNAAPERVRPVDGAREALDALRDRRIRLGVVTNQSGVARGCSPRPTSGGSTNAWRNSSARSTSGRSARTAPTTAAPAASPGPE